MLKRNLYRGSICLLTSIILIMLTKTTTDGRFVSTIEYINVLLIPAGILFILLGVREELKLNIRVKLLLRIIYIILLFLYLLFNLIMLIGSQICINVCSTNTKEAIIVSIPFLLLSSYFLKKT
jgi:hypothetical protein